LLDSDEFTIYLCGVRRFVKLPYSGRGKERQSRTFIQEDIQMMETNQTSQNTNERKIYTAPELIVYGSLEDLTLNAGGTGPDGITGGSIQTLAPESPPNYLP
jgi:hypothetical protein